MPHHLPHDEVALGGGTIPSCDTTPPFPLAPPSPLPVAKGAHAHPPAVSVMVPSLKRLNSDLEPQKARNAFDCHNSEPKPQIRNM